jgi:hypothetical protein
MHPKDIQRHVHTTLRQANNKRNESSRLQTINRPKTCVVESQELYELNQVLMSEFPTIYELIGGVEGLLMCADKGECENTLLDVCNSREKLYDNLIAECYSVLDTVAETESLHSSNDMLPAELDKEFMSWGFAETLLKLAGIYKQLLTDNMAHVLQNEKRIIVISIMESPLKGVYYIQFDRV